MRLPFPKVPIYGTVRGMIPEFPEFKKIDLSDRVEVELLTSQYPPYSDYNFNSLWSWNVLGEICISLLNSNLAVRFTDYLTDTPFYSFLGTAETNDTVQKLLDLAKSQRIETALCLLPEVSLTGLDMRRHKIEEDRDNFDYIFDIDTFLFMQSPKLSVKRKHCRYFEKTYEHHVRELNLSLDSTKQLILALFHDWTQMKQEAGVDIYFHNEYRSLRQFLDSADKTNCVAVGVFSGDRLIGASISENVGNGYNTCHYQKTVSKDFKGLNVFLSHEVAKVLAEKGIKYVNWEQDMGIPGIRASKESFLPKLFLKKYKCYPL